MPRERVGNKRRKTTFIPFFGLFLTKTETFSNEILAHNRSHRERFRRRIPALLLTNTRTLSQASLQTNRLM